MTPTELIADRDAKKVVLDAAEEVWRTAYNLMVNTHYDDPKYGLREVQAANLRHEYNVAFNNHHGADREMKDRVHELRREAEKLWFLREEALESQRDNLNKANCVPGVNESFNFYDGAEEMGRLAESLEQRIREAFDGVRLLIKAIGFDPARDLVDEG